MLDSGSTGFTGDPRLVELARTGAAPAGMSCTDLHKLTLLSMLMTDRPELQIVELALATVPTLLATTAVHLYLRDGDWWPTAPDDCALAALPVGNTHGLPVRLGVDEPAGYAVPVRSPGIDLGHLVVATAGPLADDALFPVQVLAQQLAVALDNARRHARELAMVDRLGRILHMHERLVAVAGDGDTAAMIDAVAELTGRAVALDIGGGAPQPSAGGWTDRPVRSPRARQRLIERLRREPRSVRDGDLLVALVGHRSDSTALLQLADPHRTAGEYEALVLEYAAAIAAVELARSATLLEAERQLRADLVEELLIGIPEAVARARARALGVDLDSPRRVVVVRPACAGSGGAAALDGLRGSIHRLLTRHGGAGLVIAGDSEVLCLAPADLGWPDALKALRAEAGAHPCRVAVGSLCRSVPQFPTSLRHARQAAALTAHTERDLVCFDDLGIHRLLALNNEAGDLDDYIAEWLGGLIDYGRRNSAAADLTGTLRSYFNSGASITATAAVLHLHESTVKYRLQRIVDITGHDLSDPATRFAMQVAVHALEAREALGPPTT
ncbi:MAG TPA: helix-turn-helix domain-containing protein [Sporichthyaceae bacterium]|jgi:sugar diacid utilization regulator|nr:helix-turn-helix domain-containing protein [Sporichthyaceae bacterium]